MRDHPPGLSFHLRQLATHLGIDCREGGVVRILLLTPFQTSARRNSTAFSLASKTHSPRAVDLLPRTWQSHLTKSALGMIPSLASGASSRRPLADWLSQHELFRRSQSGEGGRLYPNPGRELLRRGVFFSRHFVGGFFEREERK